MVGIVWIDMHIRDERILSRLKEHASPSGEVKVSADEISKEFLCHPNTARAILKRLVHAEHITVIQRSFRGGFVYKVRCERTSNPA